jgi:hypothetical protein
MTSVRSRPLCSNGPSHYVTSWLVTPLEVIYSSIQLSNVLVLTIRCKLINTVYQIFPHCIPEMIADYTSYIVQIISLFGYWNH